jgi:hypothetical protein
MQLGKFITLRQIFFMLYIAKASGAPFFLNNFVPREAGMAAWQLLILDDIYVVAGTYLTLKIAAKYPGEYCITYLRKLLGKYGGTLIVLLLAGHFFFQCILLSRGVANIANMSLLLTTPSWVIALLFLCPAAYAVSYGITPIARIIGGVMLFGSPLAIAAFLTILPDIYPDFLSGFWVLRPQMFTSLNFFATFEYVTCFLILYVLYPSIQATPKQILKSSILALSIASLFVYLPVTYLPMTIFGPEAVLYYRAPLYSAIKNSHVSFYIIENVGNLFYAIWFLVSFACTSLNFFCALRLIYPLLPVRNGLWLIPFGLIAPLAYIATLKSVNHFLTWIQYAGIYTFCLAIPLPLLLLLIDALRRRKEHSSEQTAENM